MATPTTLEDFFDVTECKVEIGEVLLLGFFMLIALFLITLGLTTRIGFIGIFGSLMLLITSWYVVACIQIFATMLVWLSVSLMIFFTMRGFIAGNDKTG